MRIAGALLDELIAHALEDPKNEVCGVVAVKLGSPTLAVDVHRALNVHASPLRFEIDPMELLELHNSIEAAGLLLGAIYHSHVRSKPYPSQTDIAFAANWPGVEWVIIGLTDGAAPEVRSYLIEDGRVAEVAIEIGDEEPAS